MRLRLWIALLGVVMFAAGAAPRYAGALELGGAGGRFGSLDPEGRDMTPAFGAHLDFESAGSQVHLQPGFLYWSRSGLSDVNPNMDLYYHFAPTGMVGPYLGAGVGLHLYGSDGPGDPGTDAGANFFGGLLFPTPAASFFVEGRYAATDRAQASLLMGITARLAH